MDYITLDTKSKYDAVDVTAEVRRIVEKSGVQSGAAILQSMHTTGALTINEHADPDVARDLLSAMDKMIPAGIHFRHAEGNSPAHVQTTLAGASLTVIVEGGRPLLGTWQGIFFLEFDGPRRGRKIAVAVVGK